MIPRVGFKARSLIPVLDPLSIRSKMLMLIIIIVIIIIVVVIIMFT